jgi:glycine/D-amino acid oxidase-like deaminating enzyme
VGGQHRPRPGRHAGHRRPRALVDRLLPPPAVTYGTDSGFRELGYLILAVTDEDERAGRERVAMQQEHGLEVVWLDAAEATATAVTLSPDGHRGGSYLATDGAIDPPRNVHSYSLAMQVAGVDLRERTTFTGLRQATGGGGGLSPSRPTPGRSGTGRSSSPVARAARGW